MNLRIARSAGLRCISGAWTFGEETERLPLAVRFEGEGADGAMLCAETEAYDEWMCGCRRGASICCRSGIRRERMADVSPRRMDRHAAHAIRHLVTSTFVLPK